MRKILLSISVLIAMEGCAYTISTLVGQKTIVSKKFQKAKEEIELKEVIEPTSIMVEKDKEYDISKRVFKISLKVLIKRKIHKTIYNTYEIKYHKGNVWWMLFDFCFLTFTLPFVFPKVIEDFETASLIGALMLAPSYFLILNKTHTDNLVETQKEEVVGFYPLNKKKVMVEYLHNKKMFETDSAGKLCILIQFEEVKKVTEDTISLKVRYEDVCAKIYLDKRDLFLCAGETLEEAKEYERALSIYSLLGDSEKVKEMYSKLGEKYEQEGNLVKAIEYYEKAGKTLKVEQIKKEIKLKKLVERECYKYIDYLIDFLRCLVNPSAYKGVCFRIYGLEAFDVYGSSGLFKFDKYIVHLNFPFPFMGIVITDAILKCQGTYTYITRLGTLNVVPSFEVLYWESY